MPDLFLHTFEQDGANSREYPASLREHLPTGSGYLEVKPNGDFALTIPAGGGTGTGETYYTEEVTITTFNQFPNTSQTPKYSGQDFEIITAWGDVYKVESGAFTVNTATGAITIAGGAQFQMQIGWKFLYRYAVGSVAPVSFLPFPSATETATANTGTLTTGQTYTIRASQAPLSAWQAFDSSLATFWFANVFPSGTEIWIEIEFSEDMTVADIDIMPLASLQPTHFRVLVADTHDAAGTGYTEKLVVTGETWTGATGETKNFVIPSPEAAKILRLSITQTQTSGSSPAIYNLRLNP